ncbi:hypothetical protein BST34_16080 [Mycolicibacterium monacense DSM 44395]|uniref:Uncharacterized protein n=5 Tax=Mycobacteriaceae TaxID=1762 RepID=A0AAD1MXS6_MYCMB|nr:hypothetical protein BST34_16080 [Mycolicibacterium monacense DSM 44395]QHP87781.1 hypothetical protein EWR22_21880 [Mycolicibacterium monacense DSM 44395]BBZ59032.1 hypothetical protein MMON_03330 [Mycolicibacterium monacense]
MLLYSQVSLSYSLPIERCARGEGAMRRAIAPFLATGVVLSGAAVVVANPVVPLPSDIRVSASDFTADGDRLDVLDPEFLESIGAIRQDWLSSIEELQRLFNDVSNTGRDSVISAFSAGVSVTEPSVALPVEEFTAAHERTLVPNTTIPPGVPSETLEGVVGALTDIGTSFGEAGITFVKQVTLVPAVAFVLMKQVATGLLTGEMGPIEALHRLIVEPLSALLVGDPELTGIEAIDKAFAESALKPLIRALIRNLPKPLGKEGGLIDQVDQTVDGVVVDIRDGVTPPSAVGAKPQQVESGTDLEVPLPALEVDPDGESDTPSATTQPGAPKLPKPGELARELGVRVQQGVQQGIDNFHSTIKRFTTGGKKTTPAKDGDQAGDAGGQGDTTGGKQPTPGSTNDASSPADDKTTVDRETDSEK